jgi:HMG (high mobility group) box
MEKQPEIKDALGEHATVTNISKRSAEMWKNLPPEERAHWDDIAMKDKQRYMVEKSTYTGPWQVPWKRVKKDPSAPKRPMSAFLFFSLGKRSELKKVNPSLKNTEVSRLLGEMWRSASEEDRSPHIEKEKEEREKYKLAIAIWRKEFEVKQEAQQKAHAEFIVSVGQMEQQQAIMPFDFGMTPHMGPPQFMAYPEYGVRKWMRVT